MCDLQVHCAFARSKCGCSKSEDAFQIFPISIHDSRRLDRFSVKKPCSQEQGVSKNNGTPTSSILIGFSIMFTIHFGGFSPYFWVDTHIVESPIIESLCIDMMSPQDLDDVIKAAPGAVERVP